MSGRCLRCNGDIDCAEQAPEVSEDADLSGDQDAEVSEDANLSGDQDAEGIEDAGYCRACQRDARALALVSHLPAVLIFSAPLVLWLAGRVSEGAEALVIVSTILLAIALGSAFGDLGADRVVARLEHAPHSNSDGVSVESTSDLQGALLMSLTFLLLGGLLTAVEGGVEEKRVAGVGGVGLLGGLGMTCWTLVVMRKHLLKESTAHIPGLMLDLVRPAIRRGLIGDRQKAVESLSDAAALAEFARQDPSQKVRLAAVRNVRLKDDGVLAAAAKDDELEVSLAAVERLSDQLALARLARSDGRDEVRLAAVRGVTDQAALADIARNDGEAVVRRAAVRKLTAQVVLAEVARTDCDEDTRRLAVENLTEMAIIGEIATKADEMVDVRVAAVRKLDDQNLLVRIAKTDQDESVCRSAVAEITEQALLADVARTADAETVRKLAVERLSDVIILGGIAEADSSSEVRLAAAKKLPGTHPIRRKALRASIRLGMWFEDAVGLLGSPSREITGGAVLSMFQDAVSMGGSLDGIQGRRYVTWVRPEGEWQLIFVGDRLEKIHSTP